MGRRSRKRAAEGGAVSDAGTTRAERDAARQARAARMRSGQAEPAAARGASGRLPLAERPPPLWAPFPLTELLVLAGIVLMTWGFLSGGGGREANAKLAAGLAVASIAGLELAIREHVTGFRSHTTLLSAAIAIATIVALGLGAGLDLLGPLLISGVVAFGASFYGLRELFKRRTGGAAFR
jgi:hypothetical protein